MQVAVAGVFNWRGTRSSWEPSHLARGREGEKCPVGSRLCHAVNPQLVYRESQWRGMVQTGVTHLHEPKLPLGVSAAG